MTTTQSLLTALVCLAVSGCAGRRIPGTDIEDNVDTRSILAVMEQFRVAVEKRDSQQVIALVADSFSDDGGTPSPEDDLDYPALREQLPQNMGQLDDVRLDITVRRIDVNPRENEARAIYTYNTSFRMPKLSGKPRSDSEIKEMKFKRVGDAWKITSGI